MVANGNRYGRKMAPVYTDRTHYTGKGRSCKTRAQGSWAEDWQHGVGQCRHTLSLRLCTSAGDGLHTTQSASCSAIPGNGLWGRDRVLCIRGFLVSSSCLPKMRSPTYSLPVRNPFPSVKHMHECLPAGRVICALSLGLYVHHGAGEMMVVRARDGLSHPGLEPGGGDDC